MGQHLVIVGAGQAAAQAIQSCRQLGFDGDITLVGEEGYPPYQRPPLSKKYLAGELVKTRLFLKSQSFYSSRGVELRSSVRAVEIDAENQRVRLSDGSTSDYDFLLLATGARPRRLSVPGNDLTGVHYLRSIDDVDAITPQLAGPSSVVIVGGGYIGLEVAAVCVRHGHRVTVLEAASRLMSRVVCRETAAFFAQAHAEAGVDIHCDSHVVEFNGQSRVSSVKTSEGTAFQADCVILAIGVDPNTALAASAGLRCDNGIAVDSFARTEDPRIVAAGDCTSHPHPWVGTRVRLESVHNAIEQAKAASKSLVGAGEPFDEVPWFWSDQYDLKLQIVGLARDYDTTITRGDPTSRSFAVYYLRDGQPVAIDAVNRPRDFLLGKRLLATRAEVPVDAIADTNVDLSQFLKTR
jgi:3-phenylpropionate/trans-cinnamate dioxygenase ferredoxin reductase subunit